MLAILEPNNSEISQIKPNCVSKQKLVLGSNLIKDWIEQTAKEIRTDRNIKVAQLKKVVEHYHIGSAALADSLVRTTT